MDSLEITEIYNFTVRPHDFHSSHRNFHSSTLVAQPELCQGITCHTLSVNKFMRIFYGLIIWLIRTWLYMLSVFSGDWKLQRPGILRVCKGRESTGPIWSWWQRRSNCRNGRRFNITKRVSGYVSGFGLTIVSNPTHSCSQHISGSWIEIRRFRF